MYIPFWSEQKAINKARKELYESLKKLDETVKLHTKLTDELFISVRNLTLEIPKHRNVK